jgi:Undecaprenyl-phosphate glucose phosphotransferase
MILRLKIYRMLLKLLTYSLPIMAFPLGWWLWVTLSTFLRRATLFPQAGHLTTILLSMFVWGVFAEHYRVTSFDELFRERTGARAAWSACLATFFALLATLYFSRNEIFPRALLLCDFVVLFALTMLLHAVFRVLCRRSAHFAKPTRLLIVGADRFAYAAGTRLMRLSFARCQIAGYVRLPGQDVYATNHHTYELTHLGALDPSHCVDIDEVVIAIGPDRFSEFPQIIKALEHLCLPAKAVVDLGEGVVVRDKLFQIGNIQMLDLTSTPAESLDYALLKRAFDVCFSIVILLLASPLFALAAVLIRLTSPGPIFFVQERVGLNGKTFLMYKFRSMHCSSQSESDTQWTTLEDSRRTAFGKLLRRTSIDELPQFINVLKGDMSVVGPRPERPHFVQKFLNEVSKYNTRHALKVGITGWAQVNGWRGDTSIEKRIEYDLYYLQNWSLSFDLRIIVMTIVSGLINPNAY